MGTQWTPDDAVLEQNKDRWPIFLVQGGGQVKASSGSTNCFGCYRRDFHLTPNANYVLRVDVALTLLKDLHRHTLVTVDGVDAGPLGLGNNIYRPPRIGITEYERVGPDRAKGEVRFTTDANGKATVRLWYRFSPNSGANVVWTVHDPVLTDLNESKVLTLVCFNGHRGDWRVWKTQCEKILDDLGKKSKVKTENIFVVFPEFFRGETEKPSFTKKEESQKIYRDLAEWAGTWSSAYSVSVFVCGAFYHRREDNLVYNTAPLLGPDGRQVGEYRRDPQALHAARAYDKNFLQEHEIQDGATPGDEMRVYKAPLKGGGHARIGIMTCYDSWFPEAARVLAMKGAEVILFPSQGYAPALMTARASDNGVWVAAASWNNASGVWTPGGVGLTTSGEVNGGSEYLNKDSLLEFATHMDNGTIVAASVSIDLDVNHGPVWAGYGPFFNAPTGRRARDTRRMALYDELAMEARNWSMPSTA